MESNDYILLLWKQLKGEPMDADETAALAKWRSESPENAREAEHLRSIWEKTGAAKKTFAPDLDKAFRHVQTRIRAADPSAVRGKVVEMYPRREWIWRAAAAFAVVAAAVWFVGRPSFSEKSDQVVMAMAPDGQTKEITLPDGSQVWLRENSHLEYPLVFSKSERAVKLSGEAFFSVAHNPQQPFRVETADGLQAEVLGTEFDLRTTAGGGQAAQVVVKTGKVRFTHTLSDKSVVLTANQKGVYDRQSGKMLAAPVQNLNEIAWQTGGLTFLQTPLSQVVADLEKHFDVKITLEKEALKGCPFTSPLDAKSLDAALSALSGVFGMKVNKAGAAEFRLSGGTCPQ